MTQILIISISILGEVISKLFLVRAIMSWFVSPGSTNVFVSFIYLLTEPFVAPIRNLLKKISKGYMMFDFSLMIAWILLDFVIIPNLINLVVILF